MTRPDPLEGRALYLRYRPRRFADVVAQDPVTQTLRNAVLRDTVAHAYLLCGPRGTGKTSIARILYRAINCHNLTEGEPCGECPSCRAADAGSAVDLIEMDAASHGGIDDIRDIRERVYFAPVDAKVKVYIVDEAHQLTARAWDAFLKTLEEPPPRTVFVLATTEAHRVPATIVSRCQRFDLRRIPQGLMQAHLEAIAGAEGFELEPGVAERLARLGRGSLRDAESMLEQVAAFGGRTVTMEGTRSVLGLVRGDALRSYLDALSVGDASRGLQVLEESGEQGADLRQFLDEVLFYLRGVLLARSGASAALEAHFGPEERAWLEQLAQRWAPGQIVSILRAFGEIESRGRDEHHVLVRTELVTAWCVGLVTSVPLLPKREGLGEGTLPLEPESLVADEVARVAAAPRTGAPATAQAAPAAVGEREGPSPQSSPAATASPAVGGEGGAPSPGRSTPSLQPLALDPQPGALSIAALQTQWASLLESFQGSLSARMRLRGVQPVALDEYLVTFAGPIDQLDLQRLEAPESRSAVEILLREATGLPLRVRFRQAEPVSPVDEPAPVLAPGVPLSELGSALFGGRLISDDSGQG